MNTRTVTRQGLRRTFTAVGAFAVALGALALPTIAPAPEPQYEDIPIVDVGAGSLNLVCPGSPKTPSAQEATEVSYDLDLDTGKDSISAETTLQAIAPLDGEATTAVVGEEASTLEPQLQTDATSLPRVATYPAYQDERAQAGGVTVGYNTDGDLRGLIAGPCQQPSSSMWFVGGNTDVGSSTQLILTNAGETPARVTLTGWSALGPTPGEVVELVEPGQSSVVLTETLDRTERVAFHVGVEGGQVGAYLATMSLDGIIPHGVSLVSPGAPPALDTLVGPTTLEGVEDESWTTELRVVNPGQEPAEISVSLLGEDGEEPLKGATDLTVDPGVVTEVPLAAVQPGNYTVRVTSSEPVAAGVQTVATGEFDSDLAGTPQDHSWLASGHPTGQALLIPVHDTDIALTNPVPETAVYRVEEITDDGSTSLVEEYEVGPLATTSISVPENASAVKITGEMMVASAQYSDPGAGNLVGAVPALWVGESGAEVGVVANN